MLFATKELTDRFPNHQGAIYDAIQIQSIMTDSRKDSKGSLFVPIVGETFDGHDFLNEAIKKGAIATFWQKDHTLPSYIPTDFPVFFVENTIHGLQELSIFYLSKVNPKVVAITGSNGKTTTKDLVASIVSQKFITHKTQGNLNNHIGVPLTILSMPLSTEVCVLEMGMNHFGEISVLSKIARPHFAIITNIGESHIEFLGSRDGIAKAKSEILDGLREDGTFICDGDEPLLKNTNAERKLSCGYQEENDFYISSIKQNLNSTNFIINEKKAFTFSLLGKHNVKNATFAIAVGELLGMADKDIQKGLNEIEITKMRFEPVAGKRGSLIINDAYNASPTSMKAAIQLVQEMPHKKMKVLVLGDIFELGDKSEEFHRSIAEVITDDSHYLFTVGEKAKWIAEEVLNKQTTVNVTICKDRIELIQKVEPLLQEETIVLIKGSRAMKLEECVESFKES
ncbi:UDP-N-acetylmuramoyl-tripeptide--D-alanyl-D-alanine ligase [Bacillaceae bacterium S4-13-56]